MKILENRDPYQESRSSLEKAALAHEIFYSINEIGRFLEKEKKTGLWFEQPKENAISKIKQALRDKYVPRWARDGRKFCKEICEGKHFYPVDDEPKNFLQELQDTYIPNWVPGEISMW